MRTLKQKAGNARLLAADGQSFPSLGATPFEHEATVFAAHADQKPVCALSAARVRLKCPFPLHETLSGRTETSMVANGFRECQCARDCVTVGVLSSRISPRKPHGRLVYTQSFPQLWKNLWKFARNQRWSAVFR
jgi:hypothetical protein